jgi:hypothetical protein
MNPAQDIGVGRIEYRQTGSTKIVNLFLAGLIFFIGIASAYKFSIWGSFAEGAVVSLLIFAGDAYLLARVLRSRILIEGNRISVRDALGERSATFAEIEGVRNIHGKFGASVTGKLLCLKGGAGTIEIPMMVLDLDSRFQEWLSQFPELDKTPP